jgi:hypothetical protein
MRTTVVRCAEAVEAVEAAKVGSFAVIDCTDPSSCTTAWGGWEPGIAEAAAG